MFLVNSFGRVVEIDDENDANKRIATGRMRIATEAEIARRLAEREASAQTDSDVYYSTVRNTPDGYGMSRDHIKYHLGKLGIVLSEENHDQKIGLLYNYPYSVLSMRNDVRLIYTMFESDKIPEDWPDYLNAADEVIVPSRWCQEVFAAAGVKSTVVPLGYNEEAFVYIDRGDVKQNGDCFTFIHYDSFNLRKGFMEVFNAFTQEFTKDEPVRLILKTVRSSGGIPIMKSNYPQIEVVRGVMTESELVKLLGRCDCFVYPSRGEGFGITPLEAMATGLPAIVPNEHGISEYFNSKYMLEIKATERCPGLYNRFRGTDVGNMVVCDVDDLRRKMRYAFEHQDEMRDLGRAASEYVKSYTYAKTADRLAGIIKKWQNTEIIKRGDSKFLHVEEF